ncbi:rhodanese-like domain-containing protein, partial [Streptomyces sp. GC420]|uniref:rhodanese-like domain-containing protein n=1 Tax=Streptomyces sp. GC420 TaxID=2697568 RepID=UPI001D1CD6DA
TPPAVADPGEIAARLAAGEWVVDLRNRVAFSEGHVAGSFNFELEGQLATYLAWLIPWGKPVTLLAESPRQLADAQRELVRVGIDRPAAAATGSPADWVGPGESPRSFRRAAFADLAARPAGQNVVLDVRRDAERATGHVAGSVHIPIHQLRGRLSEVPPGTVWVHCAGGMRAAVAASLLDASGRDVVAIDDDLDGARDAGLLESGPPASARADETTGNGAHATNGGSTDSAGGGSSEAGADTGTTRAATDTAGSARISPDQARERTGPSGDAVLLDVREADEWAEEHAPGAVPAPLSALAAGGPLPPAAQGRPLIVICRSGRRSLDAVRLLAERGFEAVDVAGGMIAWAEAGLPVVTDEYGDGGTAA